MRRSLRGCHAGWMDARSPRRRRGGRGSAQGGGEGGGERGRGERGGGGERRGEEGGGGGGGGGLVGCARFRSPLRRPFIGRQARTYSRCLSARRQSCFPHRFRQQRPVTQRFHSERTWPPRMNMNRTILALAASRRRRDLPSPCNRAAHRQIGRGGRRGEGRGPAIWLLRPNQTDNLPAGAASFHKQRDVRHPRLPMASTTGAFRRASTFLTAFAAATRAYGPRSIMALIGSRPPFPTRAAIIGEARSRPNIWPAKPPCHPSHQAR